MMNPDRETECTVATLTTEEAEALLKRVRQCRTFLTYGVEAFTEEAESLPLLNPATGRTEDWPAVTVKVRAGTAMQAGIGKGYLLALIG